jgi:hypothetical protein
VLAVLTRLVCGQQQVHKHRRRGPTLRPTWRIGRVHRVDLPSRGQGPLRRGRHQCRIQVWKVRAQRSCLRPPSSLSELTFSVCVSCVTEIRTSRR